MVRLVAPTGVATGDASDRLLHSETVPTRALVLPSFPSAATCSRARPCGARPRFALVPEPCGSVPIHASVFSGVPFRPSEDARTGHREARGHPMQTRLGRTALHGALPTSALGTFDMRRRFLPSRAKDTARLWHPCRLLRARGRGPLVASPMLWLEGRQDRFRGGLVKGVRIPDPGCLPSAVATRTPHVPKHERNRVSFTDRAGPHVMRMAELR